MRRRTPVRIQLDAAECGAACLGMILERYGRYVSPALLREKCEVSRSGSSAAAIVRAAHAYGLSGKGLRVELNQLASVSLPAIIHWRMSHFVVLEGFNRSFLWINDPAAGHRRVSWNEFNRCFTGIALTFSTRDDFRRGGTKPTLGGGVTSRLRGFGSVIIYCFLASLLAVVPTLFFAIGCQVFIDAAIVRGDQTPVRPLMWILLAAVVVQSVLFWLKAIGLRGLRRSMKHRLADQFFNRLFHHSLLFFDRRYPAELASRVRLNDQVAETISHGAINTLAGLCAGLCYFFVLIALSPTLSTAVLLLLLSNGLFLWIASRGRIELAQQMARSEGQLQGSSIEAVDSIESIHAANMQFFTFRRWHHFWRQTVQQRIHVQASAAKLASLSSLTTLLSGTAVIGLGGYLVLNSEMTLGTLIAFQILMPFLTAPVSQVIQLGSQLQVLTADLARLDDVVQSGRVDSESAESVRADKDYTALDDFKTAELNVQGLCFGYTTSGNDCLNDVSFEVGSGEWLGITGTSGSGKTTLARLLAGLYPAAAGQIRWNGTAIEDLDTGWFKRQIGYVDQVSTLFPATLRENLCFGQAIASDDRLIALCAELGLSEMLGALPMGLGTWIEEDGRNLSGGEKQRIDLARALLPRPAVLILDEATSALDPEMESAALSAIRKSNSMCLFISHRPSVLQQCDKVLFLDSGSIDDCDHHSQLVARNDAYRRLVGGET